MTLREEKMPEEGRDMHKNEENDMEQTQGLDLGGEPVGTSVGGQPPVGGSAVYHAPSLALWWAGQAEEAAAVGDVPRVQLAATLANMWTRVARMEGSEV